MLPCDCCRFAVGWLGHYRPRLGLLQSKRLQLQDSALCRLRFSAKTVQLIIIEIEMDPAGRAEALYCFWGLVSTVSKDELKYPETVAPAKSPAKHGVTQ